MSHPPTVKREPAASNDERNNVYSDVDDDNDSVGLKDDFDEEATTKNSVFSNSEHPSSSSDAQAEVARVEEMIAKETKVINRWRFVVILAMALVAAGVMAATYLVLEQEEENDFENSFNQYATSLLESSTFSAETIRSSCKDFSDQMTSTAKAMGETWPFVTLPDLAIHGANLRKQTNSIAFSVAHIVSETQKQNWTPYVLAHSKEWYGDNVFSPYPFYLKDESGTPYYDSPSPQWNIWQMDPWPILPLTNFDLRSLPQVEDVGNAAFALGEGIVAEIEDNNNIAYAFPSIGSVSPSPDEPHSIYYEPIYDTFEPETRKPVGLMSVVLRWSLYFDNKIPKKVKGIHLVLESTCDKVATFEIIDGIAIYKGSGDLHDEAYESYVVSSPFNTYANSELADELGLCIFSVRVYPSSQLEDEYKSSLPILLAIVVGGIFVSMALSFLAYDRFQRRRNKKVVVNAAKSNALVSSLFPDNIRDRLLAPVEPLENKQAGKNKSPFKSNKGHIKNYLEGDDEVEIMDNPIAEVFSNVTIMFADITGFTAWASMREPHQVFSLLETLFSAMDRMAKRKRVFKVETVGDCYVAVAGLPEARRDHAIVMARYARDTIRKVQLLVKHLETTLGPDTGDLGIRIGLHSGVVTAGVLRGDRSRFQLFGDAVNTTARIEASGQMNRVHMSQDTVDLLIKAGKGHWATPRENKITAKGKGDMQTYWLGINEDAAAQSVASADAGDLWGDAEVADVKSERLIDWQVDVFTRLLKQVVAHRNATTKSGGTENSAMFKADSSQDREGTTCLDEVKEIITLPEFDASIVKNMDATSVELGDNVVDQLKSYIRAVSCMYRSNEFHSFEHACHVTMSVTKLLSRIVAPLDLLIEETPDESNNDEASEDKFAPRMANRLHDHTYGITSDPLTQFSMVFSALIHDVDHMGVPNARLIEENKSLAEHYSNKSVAEQHSIDLAWELLQDHQFGDLRSCIYSTQAEYERFRQLVVQAVLATDIVDKELKELRNNRWERAFADEAKEENPQDTVNRKATIVIEHLIQASDVAHTMQHWHVYRKWNENFFRECYQAWKDGRAASDPSLNWYKGEMGFFDFYIIPLAKKLQKCGVFGVSSDEYLNYALKNRQEWENRGQQVVEEMLQNILTGQEDGSGEKETEVFLNEA